MEIIKDSLLIKHLYNEYAINNNTYSLIKNIKDGIKNETITNVIILQPNLIDDKIPNFPIRTKLEYDKQSVIITKPDLFNDTIKISKQAIYKSLINEIEYANNLNKILFSELLLSIVDNIYYKQNEKGLYRISNNTEVKRMNHNAKLYFYNLVNTLGYYLIGKNIILPDELFILELYKQMKYVDASYNNK